MMALTSFFLFLLLVYTLCANYWLCLRNKKAYDDYAELNEKYLKLQLMNKLKVDFNGEPIIYEEVK